MRLDLIEAQRLQLQTGIDRAKTSLQRNVLGQFATPPPLAEELLSYARHLHPNETPVRFLEPAIGTGAFFAALLKAFPHDSVASAHGYEIDPAFANAARGLWRETCLEVHMGDFTRARPPTTSRELPNLLICNPPYVRHHHLEASEKVRLRREVQLRTGLRLNGLSGLYCYFLCLAHRWMAPDALAGWLIPSEFMDVKYGQQIKDYLTSQVTLLAVHRFNPIDRQFAEALVSSAVVWIRNRPPESNHRARFTYGGRLLKPDLAQEVSLSSLRNETKWTRFPRSTHHATAEVNHATLGDLFRIQRGLATGNNSFFVLTHEQVAQLQLPASFLLPILPSPRYLDVDEVAADHSGLPRIARQRFLVSCDLPEATVQSKYPALWRYYQQGVAEGVHAGYICAHRSPWYRQENRPTCPLLLTYMGRSEGSERKPFRFILNHSRATAPNVYLLLYPKPDLHRVLAADPRFLRTIWQALNQIPLSTLTGEGRVYGGGLHKLEPKELANVPANVLFDLCSGLPRAQARQLTLVMEKCSEQDAYR